MRFEELLGGEGAMEVKNDRRGKDEGKWRYSYLYNCLQIL